MSDEYSNKLTDDIVKYGFEVIMVPKTNYLPSFAYTVGLWKSYKHSELISLGLPIDTLHTMLNTVVFEIIKKEILEEADKKIKMFFEELEKVEMIELLGDKESLNAIVTIHSGAGGKEACDWAQMLYRMYTKWSAKEGYEIEEIDFQEGDGVGYKSITFVVKGEYASEILSGEMGVHRLVRISPFDSSKRRHTSFASVEVLPEVEEQTEVEIRSEDLRIDTYRASGARTDNM